MGAWTPSWWARPTIRAGIEQGYVALDDDAEVRVRRAGDKRTLTIKSAPGMVRAEVELGLEEEQFERAVAADRGPAGGQDALSRCRSATG